MYIYNQYFFSHDLMYQLVCLHWYVFFRYTYQSSEQRLQSGWSTIDPLNPLVCQEKHFCQAWIHLFHLGSPPGNNSITLCTRNTVNPVIFSMISFLNRNFLTCKSRPMHLKKGTYLAHLCKFWDMWKDIEKIRYHLQEITESRVFTPMLTKPPHDSLKIP